MKMNNRALLALLIMLSSIYTVASQNTNSKSFDRTYTQVVYYEGEERERVLTLSRDEQISKFNNDIQNKEVSLTFGKDKHFFILSSIDLFSFGTTLFFKVDWAQGPMASANSTLKLVVESKEAGLGVLILDFEKGQIVLITEAFALTSIR